MAQGKNDRRRDEGRAEQIVSTAAGAAEALSVGVIRLTERTLIEALHAVEEVGSELGSVVVRATRGSIKAADDIGGDLAEVGKGVTRGVVDPARRLGGEVARRATNLWTNATNGLQSAARGRVRKAPAKAEARQTRRRPAA
jgi:hypothetical protein